MNELEHDLSLERIAKIAVNDVVTAIHEKIGRALTDDEFGFIDSVVGTEHFWARAEEILMFVRQKTATDVLDAITKSGIWYRERLTNARDVKPESVSEPTTNRKRSCDMCNSTGVCYCIRKGPGNSSGCPRCESSGSCRYCRGTGGE